VSPTITSICPLVLGAVLAVRCDPHASRRDRKRWKETHRMPMHSRRLRSPGEAGLGRVAHAVLAAAGVRNKKRHHRQKGP
jgi:hypothetical protein